ncbi:MAG: O-acetyl-ADP-ribose deacetylase [Thiomargarita sp.]|nr:O-acetyl-ADP-ribose deacetylase [Thiomargarita sp.]
MSFRIKLIQDDITTLSVDAIVNAANSSLLGGGGVDGAIHRVASSALLAECRTLNGCSTGQAKITQAYQLPCQYVIHTVGPIWKDGQHDEKKLLEACYINSLNIARKNTIKTIAFPAISCGAYSYPIKEATEIAVQIVANWLQNDSSVELVYFVAFNNAIDDFYRKALSEI